MNVVTYIISLFTEVLVVYLQGKPSSGLNIKDTNLLLLHFADDTVILGETLEDYHSVHFCRLGTLWLLSNFLPVLFLET